jgi:hypothetical protein
LKGILFRFLQVLAIVAVSWMIVYKQQWRNFSPTTGEIQSLHVKFLGKQQKKLRIFFSPKFSPFVYFKFIYSITRRWAKEARCRSESSGKPEVR